MNINSLSQNIYATNINQTKYVNLTSAKSNLSKDTFVKSATNVSFGSINETKYSSIKKDMTEYFMNAETLSVEEIGTLVKKHLPDTNFDDIKNLPKELNVNRYAGAYTSEPTEFYIADNGNIQATSKPKTIYLNFHTSTQNKQESRIILLDRLLHEMTHVLQDEKGSNVRKEDFFNKYLLSQPNQQRALASIQAMNMIFNATERTMFETFVSCSQTSGSLPKEVNRNTNINSLFMKKTKMTANTIVRNSLSKTISNANMNFGAIDENFALDFVILKAKNEKEAYQNALNSDKELLKINSKTDFDLRIEMYESIIETAQNMKS